MNRIAISALALLMFLCAEVSSAQGVASSPNLAGQKIERFEVIGNTSVASDTIRVYLGISPGEVYDPAALQRNFLNLWQTGLFDDIKIEGERGDGGVVVKVTVQERPRIGAVEYRGNKSLTATKIGEALEKDKIDLHVGSSVEQTLIRRATESIRKAYAEGGFDGVTVESLSEKMSEDGEQKLIFTINEGIKAKVASIRFEGNQRFSDRRLRNAMKEVKTSNLYTWIRKKNIYTPSKLDEDMEKVKNLYLDHGYKDIEFGDPKIVTTGSKKRPRVKLSIPVKEGVVHTFGEVKVTGNTVFTEEQIIGNWPIKKGETLRRKPIQSRLDVFDEAYRRRGYIYAYVNPEYQEKENNVVDVSIQVFEGDQFKLGRLEFLGNLTTKDKVLRREVFLEEGMIMDMETFKQSVYKLGQLGYFKVTENPDFKVNQETKTVDISIKGQEEGKNDVQFGGGYSETYGFFGQFQFSTRNFLGEGENFGVSFQRGRRQNFFSLSYSDPWFLDTPNSFGVSIFDRQTTFPSITGGFETRSKGATLAYGYRLGRFESVSLLYGYDRTNNFGESAPPPDENGNIPLPLIQDFTYITSAIIPSYRYDSRDNSFDTSRGARASVSMSFSGGPLGGSVNNLKPVVNYSRFRPISRKSILSFNVEAGSIFPLAKDCANVSEDLVKFRGRPCVPPGELFYVGGESSIRGFSSSSVGPREPGTNFVRGSYKYNVLNFEYVYRVNDPLRFVLFADAGNGYGFEQKWDPSDLRYSAGAEMRIFLPVFQFPLRFIYAFNLDPREDDRFSAFQFTLGSAF
ncbi:MAG TPA: outer membrane protein assembly factor BamA [Thermoanaerobaculia bacterium]|nr:outer membrane protein assembly factor BamA [Thermoanaerobaculia bacterium]